MNRAFSIVWNSSRQVWAVAPEGVARACASSGRPAAGLQLALAACLLGFAGAAAADCSGTTGIVCVPGVNQATTVGTGPGTASGATVTVQPGAVVSTGEQAGISTGDNGSIDIQAGATVQNNATTNDGGFYGAGPNTIEFGSDNTLTIGAGATVQAAGNSGTGETINPIGTGNTIINNGSIDSQGGGAAIWLQSGAGSTTIVNGVTGTINYMGGGNANLLGVGGTMAVNFTNQGTLLGSLNFADGDDTFNAATGSTISGSVNGGGGNNTLMLSGTGTDTFTTGFTNFQTLVKTDSGSWTFNSLPGSGITSAEVAGGTLVLGADSSGYAGSMTVDAAGTLQTNAAFMPLAITDNGLVRFDQGSDASAVSYAGLLSGSGGIEKAGAGTLIFAGDQAISGTTTISGGTLQLGSGGSTGSVGGPIVDNAALVIDHSNGFIVSQPISGSGSVTQSGSGTTTYTADNSYAGGTIISAGVLQLGNGGTTGSLVGPVLDNAALVVNRSNDLSLAGVISGSGSFAQIGTGTTILAADNSYGGGTTISAGTLQLGNGGTTGSVVGPILDNGSLSVDHSDSFTIAAPISGSGRFAQIGSGTTILTADNSYGGGTTISAGTLQLGAGGTTGSVIGPIVNNGALAVDHATSFTIAAPISGSGSFAQIGSGTTILTADNSYSGATTINAGTLQLGNGGATGSLVGPVLDNAVLVVNRSNDLTLAGVISGSGSFSQIGTGTTILAADNSYSGGTTISAGTLQLGNGGTTGSVVGPVLNNGALAIDHSNSFMIAAPISGSGSFAQIGSGTTILAATNTYSGTTTVAAGSLQAAAANAFSSASAHAVAAGATLDTGGFNQTVAALSNSGTVNLLSGTPGSTLTVTGAYVGNNGVINLGTVLAGSTSLSDRLVLSGPSASASGSTTLRITNLGGLGAQTTGNGIAVVSAINGATTTAQTTKNAFALTGGHVDAGAYSYQLYAADASGAGENWYLRSSTATPPVGPVLPGPPFPLLPDLPGLPGGPGSGGSITTYRSEVPLLAALPAQLRQSDLSMLSNLHRRIGDEAAPGAGAATADAGNGRQVWARAIYNDIDIRQDGIAAAQSQGHVSGLQAGTDLLASGSWRAGVYVGSLDGNADVSGNAHGIIGAVGSVELRSRYLGGYATWFAGNGLYVDSVLQGGSHDYTAQPNDGLSASGKAGTLSASVEGGRAFDLGQGWKIEPQAQLIYQRASFDNLLISGALVRQDADAGWIGRLGVRIRGDIATGAGRLQPYARVNVYRASGGTDLTSFIGPAAGTAIGSATGYTSTEFAGGMTLALNAATTLYGEVGQLYSSGGAASVKSSFQGSLGIRVSW